MSSEEQQMSLVPSYPKDICKHETKTPLSGKTMSQRLWQLFKPDDDTSNTANEYRLKRFAYSHAFITAGFRETPTKVELDIIHYSKVRLSFLKITVEVAKQPITATKRVLQDGTVELYLSKEDKQSEGSANIYKPLGKGKVFRITNPYYPQDKQSRKAAVDHALRKVGQQGYSASSLNCQHFVAEILTGRRYCMDLEVKSQRIVIAFLLDSAGFVALQLVVKKLLGLLPKAIYVCVKGIFSKDAWTNGMLGWGSDGWRGFCSKGHTAVAHLKHAGASVGIGVGISILLEALMLVGQTIYEYKQYKEGKLDAKDFAKSFTKNLASSSGSVLGTFIGTLVGCGIPVPGMMFVGAMVGGFLGRFIGYAIAHYRTERSDSDTWLIKKITKKLEQKSLCQKAE